MGQAQTDPHLSKNASGQEKSILIVRGREARSAPVVLLGENTGFAGCVAFFADVLFQGHGFRVPIITIFHAFSDPGLFDQILLLKVYGVHLFLHVAGNAIIFVFGVETCLA